ncbi:MAG: hypothetical protein J2P55_14425, partial [Rhizobiales bacterium]|nr:hypothetical protein [Hyphomicrobiales bacterium]
KTYLRRALRCSPDLKLAFVNLAKAQKYSSSTREMLILASRDNYPFQLLARITRGKHRSLAVRAAMVANAQQIEHKPADVTSSTTGKLKP